MFNLKICYRFNFKKDEAGDNYILLDNGFSADSSIDFIAKIEDCNLGK